MATRTVSATATAVKQVQVSRLARGMHGRIGVAQGQGQDGIFGGGPSCFGCGCRVSRDMAEVDGSRCAANSFADTLIIK